MIGEGRDGTYERVVTHIVIKNGRNVIRGELVGGVRDEEAGLLLWVGEANGAVSRDSRCWWTEKTAQHTFPTAPSPTTYRTRSKAEHDQRDGQYRSPNA